MAEIVVLGSGAGFASMDRFSTSIAVCHDAQISMFDCGEPCAALMFRAGLNPLAVRNVFISHMHPDHVAGLAPLLFSMYLPGREAAGKQFRPWSVSPKSPWYQDAVTYPEGLVASDDGRYPPVSVHLPSEALPVIDAYLSAVYLAPEILPFDLILQGLNEGSVLDDGNIPVRALSNSHLSANQDYHNLPSLYPHMALESYSFSFDVVGKTIVYSGDITALAELDPLLNGADIVIVEVAHFDPEELEPALSDSSAEEIVLTHIHPGLENRVKKAIEAWGDDRVSRAYDGFRIRLDEK